MPWKPFRHICEKCNKEFIVPRPQKFCSYKCSATSAPGREVRRKNIEKIMKNPLLNNKRASLLKQRVSGVNNWHWKGGISIGENKKDYKSYQNLKRELNKRNNGGIFIYKEWLQLKQYCLNRCVCCRKSEPEIKLTKDHIIPLSLNGTSNIENIQPLCQSCNSKKRQQVIKFIGIKRSDYEEYLKSKNIELIF